MPLFEGLGAQPTLSGLFLPCYSSHIFLFVSLGVCVLFHTLSLFAPVWMCSPLPAGSVEEQ